MPIKIYQYPTCSTCRKALTWLELQKIEYTPINIAQHPPSSSVLKDLWERSGQPIQKLFNTSGKSYREGGFKTKLQTMSEDGALQALAEDGMLIKRPIVDTGNEVLIGFHEGTWQRLLV